jgi:hypothetical protein
MCRNVTPFMKRNDICSHQRKDAAAAVLLEGMMPEAASACATASPCLPSQMLRSAASA